MRRFIVLAGLLVLAASALAQPQPAPPKFTWVRHYQVPPGREADFLRTLRESAKPALDALQRDGRIAGWGVAAPVTRGVEPWTHLVYAALPNWSSAGALDEALAKAGPGMDRVMRHLVQSTAMPTSRPKFLRAELYVIKPGRNGDAVQLFNEWATPLFTDLAKNGQVAFWGFSAQEIPGDEEWTHMVWYFLSDLGGLDGVDASLEGLGRQKLTGYEVRLRDMSEPARHRAQILRLIDP